MSKHVFELASAIYDKPYDQFRLYVECRHRPDGVDCRTELTWREHAGKGGHLITSGTKATPNDAIEDLRQMLSGMAREKAALLRVALGEDQ